MTTKITEKNISNLANAGVQWQSVITADGSTTTTGVAGRGYFINTTNAAHTFTLPATATFADTIIIKDYAGTFGTNKLTIARNGHNIQGVANNSQIGTNRASVTLVYVDITRGWEYVLESNVADLQLATFISATGGTVTTSGNFKIHSFTGDGCFVVSTIGNGSSVPTGGPAVVDYLVVAGGGSAGGGGGGAGGFRESYSTPVSGPYTASPLATPTGITLTATTYPITVGAGGGGRGSNSVFSTITSTGGGSGMPRQGLNPADSYNAPGGSGGGRGHDRTCAGGTGNTPPTSPSQGNNGGTGQSGPFGGAGGGGGATAAGSNAGSKSPALVGPGGAGGAGATTSISGSPTAYAGGGGGGNNTDSSDSSPALGGTGGGGNGSTTSNGNGTNASVNTGGGGGGGEFQGSCGSGGSGIVIIRYKFQ